jgi:hypothetical protein
MFRHAHDTGWLGAKSGMELARDLRRLPRCGGSAAGFPDAAGAAGATSVNDLRARPWPTGFPLHYSSKLAKPPSGEGNRLTTPTS